MIRRFMREFQNLQKAFRKVYQHYRKTTVKLRRNSEYIAFLHPFLFKHNFYISLSLHTCTYPLKLWYICNVSDVYEPNTMRSQDLLNETSSEIVNTLPGICIYMLQILYQNWCKCKCKCIFCICICNFWSASANAKICICTFWSFAAFRVQMQLQIHMQIHL